MEIDNTYLIKIEYQVLDPVYPYQDILEFTIDEWNNITDEEIQLLQEDRYNKWRLKVTNNLEII